MIIFEGRFSLRVGSWGTVEVDIKFGKSGADAGGHVLASSTFTKLLAEVNHVVVNLIKAGRYVLRSPLFLRTDRFGCL
jgi:hypothetical protein